MSIVAAVALAQDTNQTVSKSARDLIWSARKGREGSRRRNAACDGRIWNTSLDYGERVIGV